MHNTMRKVFTLVFAMLIVASFAEISFAQKAPKKPRLTAKQLLEQAMNASKDATVQVAVYEGGGKRPAKLGSGFLYESQLLVTSAGNVKNASRVGTRAMGGKEFYATDIAELDTVSDIAILRMKEVAGAEFTPKKTGSLTPKTKLYELSYSGTSLDMLEGKVDFKRVKKVTRVETDITVDTKKSGGAVINAQAKLVGMLSAYNPNGKVVSVAGISKKIKGLGGKMVRTLDASKLVLGPEVRKIMYPSGKLRIEATYEEDVLNGLFKSYAENGNLEIEETYLKAKLNGLSKRYYPNGKVSEEKTYVAGKKSGVMKTFYETGFVETEQNYKNDLPDGPLKSYSYYENGNLKEEFSILNGKVDGVKKTYYESGMLQLEENYRAGQREGTRRVFRESGLLAIAQEFANDKLTGEGKEYHDDSSVIKSITTYQNGVGVKRIIYNERGDKKDELDKKEIEEADSKKGKENG